VVIYVAIMATRLRKVERQIGDLAATQPPTTTESTPL
jgi:hypothetical protein